MALQNLNSPNINVEPEFSDNAIPAQYLLLWFRWALTTSWFLFLLAAVLVGLSLLASFYTDAWHWFQRSGALMVSIGAVLSTRRALRLIPPRLTKLPGRSRSGKPGSGPTTMRLADIGSWYWKPQAAS